jgi:hypothetical protein
VKAQKAKVILLAYRPGTSDREDAEIREALDLVEKDSELREWFGMQQQIQEQIRRELRGVAAPKELRDRILQQYKIIPVTFWSGPKRLLAVAAIALFASGLLLWMRPHDVSHTFASFRSRMVGEVLRVYAMDILTNNPSEVRKYLAEKGAPADFGLPRNLEKLPVLGGGRLYWGAKPVAMMCFEGKSKETLFLFVLKANEVSSPDGLERPVIENVKGLPSASWKQGENIYVLAGRIDPNELLRLTGETSAM